MLHGNLGGFRIRSSWGGLHGWLYALDGLAAAITYEEAADSSISMDIGGTLGWMPMECQPEFPSVPGPRDLKQDGRQARVESWEALGNTKYRKSGPKKY